MQGTRLNKLESEVEELKAQLPPEIRYTLLKEEIEAEREREREIASLSNEMGWAIVRGKLFLLLIHLLMLGTIAFPVLTHKTTAEHQVIEKNSDNPALSMDAETNHKIANSLVDWAKQHHWVIRSGKSRYNIFYLEGVNPDGSLNDNKPNEFNALRVLLEIIDDKPRIVRAWKATVKAGSYFNEHPMNVLGTARVNPGQYRAWQLGFHKDNPDHPALIQVKGVNITRNGSDKYWDILGGFNQHAGYDNPEVDRASAGCLVGQSWKGHKEFIELLRQDTDYKTDRNYIFYTGIVSGKDLFR